MGLKRPINLNLGFIVAAVFLAVIAVVVPNLNTDKPIDFGVVGTVYSVEDFQPVILSDDFKTWIERVKSFTAVSMDSDTVTERNFDRIVWQLVSEQANFLVRPRIDSIFGGRPKLVAVIEIPNDIYNNFIDRSRDSM